MHNCLPRKRSGVASWMSVAMMTTCLGLGLSAHSAAAGPGGNGAQKVPITRTNRDCFGVVQPPLLTEPFGFSIIKRTGSGDVIANVVLQNATPNTTYDVRVIQTPSGADCGVIDGTLTTDASGYGQTNIREALLPGSTDAFVVLNNQTNFGGDFFTTQDVVF